MDLGIKGHVALVTGAASGIGRAIAEGFAAEGADLALWDVSPTEEWGNDLAAQFQVRTISIKVDVSDEEQVRAGTQLVESTFGPIRHVVHSAAVGSGKFGFPFSNLEPADWLRVLDVNVMGMVHVAHAIAPLLRFRGDGTLLFVASVAGQIGSQTDPPYSASKAANINFAQCLAKDLAPYGVRVNTICPGMVQTPLNQSVWAAWNAQQPESARLSYEDWANAKIRNVVPLGRWQQPEDIADMALFLSSDCASQVTGQTINVDGGFVMHW